jgi:DNA repair photolyase
MPFEWSINPYRGCQHGCSFCYARATHAFLGMETDDAFQNHILLKANAAEALERQLTKLARSRGGLRAAGRIAIGTATDPYQPAEAKAKLTRQCLEVLARYRMPVSITTRSPLILRDLDLLRRIPILSVNISMNTLNHRVWRNMEASSPSPIQRLKTVQQLTEAGIPAGVFLAPILPLITDSDEELEAVVKAASRHGAKFVSASYLRLNHSEVKVWYFHVLQQTYPELVGKYGELYAHSSTADPAYRTPRINRIRELIRQHQLESTGFFREPATMPTGLQPEAEPPSQPVQLSFPF